MKLKRHEDFINESIGDIRVHDGNFTVTIDQVQDGRFIKGEIPDVIRGSFDCRSLELTTLEGGPMEVDVDYMCGRNKLTDLKGAPRKVGKHFSCSNNILMNLEGAPREIGMSFIAKYCNLTSLEGGPEIVGLQYNVANNAIENLYYHPKSLDGMFSLEGNVFRLSIEKQFLHDHIYGNNYNIKNYWTELLLYCLEHSFDLERIEWPDGFLNDNLKASAKGINKFKM